MSYIITNNDLAPCYKVVAIGSNYQIYRVLAYTIHTKEPAIAEAMEAYNYENKALAYYKRSLMEKELFSIIKYGFTHYEDIY